MITIIGREIPRKELAAILKAAIDTALGVDALVVAQEPKETGGRSPIVTVHGAGSRLEFTPYAREYHRYWVTWYWLRDDEALTEDRFDDLSRVILQTLVDNVTVPGKWSDLLFGEDFSEVAYVVLEGKQHRTEKMIVTVESICDNG